MRWANIKAIVGAWTVVRPPDLLGSEFKSVKKNPLGKIAAVCKIIGEPYINSVEVYPNPQNESSENNGDLRS